MNTTHWVGIDVAKAKFDLVLLPSGNAQRLKHKIFQNTAKGHKACLAWLNALPGTVSVCLEATGHYSEGIAEALYEADIDVSVENPYQIKQYARARLMRSKTDRLDAEVIAHFGQHMPRRGFVPRSETQKRFRELVRVWQTLKAQITQLSGQFESLQIDEARDALDLAVKELTKQAATLEKQLRAMVTDNNTLKQTDTLLRSIKGVGDVCIYTLMAYLPPIEQFHSAKALAAFFGVCPRDTQSGAYSGKTRMSRQGSTVLRKALYMPAISVKTHNTDLQPFIRRLQNKGLAPKAIVGALMRKLVHLIYGILKHQRPFDPNLCCKA